MTERRQKIAAIVDWLRQNEQNLATDITQRCPNTCAMVWIPGELGSYRGIGFSKVCWPDAWDMNKGVTLATAKAIKHLAVQLVDSDIEIEMILEQHKWD